MIEVVKNAVRSCPMELLMASQRSVDGYGGLGSLSCWASFSTMTTIPGTVWLETKRFSKPLHKPSDDGRLETSRSTQLASSGPEPIRRDLSYFPLPLLLKMDGREKRREVSGFAVVRPA